MADPRSATTSRIGVDPDGRTYKADGVDIVYDGTKADGSVSAGLAVMISANGTVRLTADGSRVLGKLLKVSDDGFCSVQIGGVVTLPSSGTITPGTAIVGALNSAARGYVRSVVPATLADVAAGNHIVNDASDAANVEIELYA